jgi:3-oxoacyl-[acyl-carrier protein] reductase
MSEKRVVLVTASTRGIGRVIARRFAQEGAVVALNYRSNDQEAAEVLLRVQQDSPRSRVYKADVSHPQSAEGLIKDVVRDHGRLDLLVNNAGPMLVKSLFDTSPDEWEWMIRSNLSSVFYCTKYALAVMREQKSGQILNIGCLHAEIAPGGLPNSPAYGVAKSGVLMLTRMFARSEARYNIRVNAINPGLIETDAYGHYPEDERQKWMKRVPQKRFGSPDDIAEAALFLTSERAGYITGCVLPVHGGLWIPD